jgi:hypothetical protein
MQYAARLPRRPSTRSLAAPLIALIVGAGAATGAYALIDDGNAGTQATKYVVLDQSAFPGKDEAATGAAISTSQSTGVQLRGSKASATTTKPTAFSGPR